MKSKYRILPIFAILFGTICAYSIAPKIIPHQYDFGVASEDATYWYIAEEINNEFKGVHFECEAVAGTPTCAITTNFLPDGAGRIPKVLLSTGDAVVLFTEKFVDLDSSQ